MLQIHYTDCLLFLIEAPGFATVYLCFVKRHEASFPKSPRGGSDDTFNISRNVKIYIWKN